MLASMTRLHTALRIVILLSLSACNPQSVLDNPSLVGGGVLGGGSKGGGNSGIGNTGGGASPATPNDDCEDDNADDEKCFSEKFVQPDERAAHRLDLLFVTDTSGSIQGERGAIANGIRSFIGSLPENTDLRVGIMLAHGSSSYWMGRLYYSETVRKNTPVVLDNVKMPLAYVQETLRNRLMHAPSDYYSDGGELQMASLLRGLDEDRMSESKKYGFFRDDAALAIIFISDENDICATYPAGVKPVKDWDYYQGRPLESIAKDRDCTRKLANGAKESVSADLVAERLKKLQGSRALAVSGIVYNNHATYPRDGENEYGYGMLDVIEKLKGTSADMADKNFSKHLAVIGDVCRKKMELTESFKLSNSPVDAESIRVSVDGRSTEFTFDAQGNFVKPVDVGGARSSIVIDYCLVKPQPTPSPSVVPTPVPTPSVTPAPSPTPTAAPSPEPSPSVVPTPEPTPVVTPTPDVSPTPVVEPTPVSSPTPVPTSSPTPGPSPTPSSCTAASCEGVGI